MCGIAGAVVAAGERPDPQVLQGMCDALAHRGPDDARTAVWGRAGFAFRRLSIIDVAGGAQPLDNEDGSVHVILNGEVYNYQELRAQLEARGHRFATGSDAEVVVHGYEEYSDAVVERLRGMFAFAVWDARRQRLLLARDRLGKKPLVYYEGGGRLAFASELRALVADPAVPREADPVALFHYLTYQYVPAPLTAFLGIRKLPPAHRLVFEDGHARVERYWTLHFEPKLRLDEEEAAGEVLRLLREAVRMRLMSEVPLGAFLSGGIDSSAVVALMAEVGPVKTFSIGFAEQEFDELPYARAVAERFATDHHEFVVRPQAAELVPRLVEHYGEPYADSSALPTWELSRVTAGHVKVALTGDGGDELFAGYDRYRFLRLLEAAGCFGAVGRGLRRLTPRRLADLPRLPARLRRAIDALGATAEESYARLVSAFRPEDKHALLRAELRARLQGLDSYQWLYQRFAEGDARDLLDRMLYADVVSYLPDDLLAKVDIAAMAHGLECRAPLLDHVLVEFAARLPPALKLGLGRGKRVLRRALSGLIPEPILQRRKMGFGVPISRWFRAELKEMLHDSVLAPSARINAYLDPTAVRRLADQHESGARDNGYRLWALLMLELWLRRFVDGPSAPLAVAGKGAAAGFAAE